MNQHQEITLPVEVLREYIGVYPRAPGIDMSLTEEGGALFSQMPGRPKLPLFAVRRDEFFYKITDVVLKFERDATGRVIGCVTHQRLTKIPVETTRSEGLQEYAGNYSRGGGIVMAMTEENGALCTQITGQPKFSLLAGAKDEFLYQVGDSRLGFERDVGGKVVSCVLHQRQRRLPPEVTLPIEVLREYVGVYPRGPGVVTTVTEENGVLFVQTTGQPKWQVHAAGRDNFFHKMTDAELSFERDATCRISHCVFKHRARQLPSR